MPGYRVGLQPTVQFLSLMVMFPSRSIGPSIDDATRCRRRHEVIKILDAIEVRPSASPSGPNQSLHLQSPDRRGRLVAQVLGGLGGREVGRSYSRPCLMRLFLAAVGNRLVPDKVHEASFTHGFAHSPLRPWSSGCHARNSDRWPPIKERPGRPARAPLHARRPGSTGEGEPPMSRTGPRRPVASAMSYVVARGSRGLGGGRDGEGGAAGRAAADAGTDAEAGDRRAAALCCSRHTRSRRNRSRRANSTVVDFASAVFSLSLIHIS